MLIKLDQHHFQRLFVCLDAAKIGLKFCKLIITFNECFLKVGYWSNLLVVVARDANGNVSYSKGRTEGQLRLVLVFWIGWL